MSRLEEIKNQIAIENGYNHWDFFISDIPIYRREDHYDEIAKRYATEVAKASLEKASDKVNYDYCHQYSSERNMQDEICSSITSESNIVIL